MTYAVPHQPNCEICDRLALCRAGQHPGFIAELDTAVAVLGDSQQFRGYSLLLCKTPATELHELPKAVRLRFLEEMSQLAEAVARAVKPFKLNYECLGNMVHHLHFHIFPRHPGEAQPTMPVWGQMHAPGSPEARRDSLDPATHADLIRLIRHELRSIRAHEGAASETSHTPATQPCCRAESEFQEIPSCP